MDADEAYVRDRLAGKRAKKRPTLLVAYGPPASGKGSCLAAFAKAVHPGVDISTYVHAVVDDVVSSLDVGGRIKTDPDYYHVLRPHADAIIAELIRRAVAHKYDLLIETTGGRIDLHVQDSLWRRLIDRVRAAGYRIVVVYPLVGRAELIRRSDKRAAQIGRRPGHAWIHTAATNAAANIKGFIGVADKIVVFDNRGAPPCDYRVIICDKKGACAADVGWVVDRAVAELFGVELAREVRGGAAKRARMASLNLLEAVLIALAVLAALVFLVAAVARAGPPGAATSATLDVSAGPGL